jgi:FkbM family methyltransferase
VIESVAVSDMPGEVEFGVEESGKLGGIGVDTGRTITVPCRHVMEILEEVLGRHGVIDCLKIDTEGTETRILKAIDPECWKYIRCVNVEDHRSGEYLPAYFAGTWRGSAMRFVNTSLEGA